MVDILDTQFEGKEIELAANHVKIGDDINITAKDPTLRKVLVGVGWDLKTFDSDVLDVDVSLFLVGKDGTTRADEDFIFYNNQQACEGGIKHGGDSRTGAGDGDDETISIDLHSVPFDVMKLVFVLSIYKGEERTQSMAMVRNSYLRLVNEDNAIELMRYNLDENLQDRPETAMIVGSLNREGPKWHFTPVAEFVDGGLKVLAERFGMVIAEQ